MKKNAYNATLHPWGVYRLESGLRTTLIHACRTRNEADHYANFLQRNTTFRYTVAFEPLGSSRKIPVVAATTTGN